MAKMEKIRRKNAAIAAIDMFAKNPNMTYERVAQILDVTPKTISVRMSNPEFIDKMYSRYMEVAGVELPAVIQAVIEEAKRGNVHAARLVLEHFGKLENKIKIQVESNFEKFMKVDETEDADFFEVSDEQEEVLELISDPNISLPERDPTNDTPEAKTFVEKKSLKATQKEITMMNRASERYKVRKRAKAVGLPLLSPGRHTRTERQQWMQKLEQLEKEKNSK